MDEWRQDWADRESIDRQTDRERERGTPKQEKKEKKRIDKKKKKEGERKREREGLESHGLLVVVIVVDVVFLSLFLI